MPVFLWEGKNRKNETQKGEIDVEDEQAVKTHLNRIHITPVKIKKKPKDLFENITFLQPGVKIKDVTLFSRQFSTMIDAGLPILQCLDILHAQQENPTFKKMLKEIKNSVASGETLADSLKKYPKQFDDLFVNMIAAGEAGGILDTILQRLSEYLEKAAKLKAKVKGAMVYPIITVIVAVIVVAVIMIFVIPVFESMFADMGGSLPAPTLVVVALSDFTRANIGYIIGAVIIFIIVYKKFYATVKGRAILDDLFLKLPAFGILLRKVAVAKFTRTLGTMLNSGVAILDALDIVAKTAGNKTIETAIYKVRSDITAGRTMAAPLEESGVFPSMVCQMISVGEATGALDAMLEKIADFYDEEVDQAVENLTSMIEPFMMVFLGVVIGGLVIAMYLPIFTMASAVS